MSAEGKNVIGVTLKVEWQRQRTDCKKSPIKGNG